MPSDIIQHFATDPTPMCLAFARHVIAARQLFSGKPTRRTWLCAIDSCIKHLLLHGLPLILQAGLWTPGVSIAVVVTEFCSTILAAHVCNHAVILPGVRSTQPAALWAGSQLGVGLHPPESIQLFADLMAEPLLQLLLGCQGFTTIISCQWTFELVYARLVNAETQVSFQTVCTRPMLIPAASVHHKMFCSGDVLQTYAA